MSVEVERQKDGHWLFQLGPLEKAIAFGCVLTVGSALIYTVKTQSDMKTQLAVLSGQMSLLGGQLSDVPVMRAKQAEFGARITQVEATNNRQDADIADLRRERPGGGR